eukprot:INCI19131.1.p1 GENE.INCI19131.1~~INCI19131.1.p1  ORF type:complete len:501 (-),score=118.30 INCI19131.1:105-1478(-)
MRTAAVTALVAAISGSAAASESLETSSVSALQLTASDVLWLAEHAWGVHSSVLKELQDEDFTLAKLDCSFLDALKSEPFRFMHFQHFCNAATEASGQQFVKTVDTTTGNVQNLAVEPSVAPRRRLAASDKWSGLNIKSDSASITFGTSADVGIYRTGDNQLNFTAAEVVVHQDLTVTQDLVVSDVNIVDGIASNAAAISSNAAAVSANEAAISANTNDIANNAAAISSNAADIATNAGDISTNADNIATNGAAISVNEGAIASNAIDISTNAGNIAANAADISTNAATISSVEAALDSRVTAVAKSALCSRTECCNDQYSWSGSVLYCWNTAYSSYDADPCGCRAQVYNLGSATAFTHQQNCISKGGHLMSVHSAAAMTAVAAYTTAYLWIGLYDRKVEGNFHWFDGTQLMYTAWNSNEPNDSSGEDCVHTTGTSRNLWNDQDCEELLPYYGICLFV